MVDRLRLFLNRPLRDSDRPRLFALAVVLIIATAAVLALVDGIDPAPTPARDASADRASVRTAERVESPSAPSPTPTPMSEEGRPARDSIASPAEIARAKGVARRFLRGYLRYSYGQAPARAIVGGTERLRRRLSKARPRVPIKEQRRWPQLVLVQSDSVTRVRARVLGFVRDGERRYTVPLELARTRGGWRVVSVGT